MYFITSMQAELVHECMHAELVNKSSAAEGAVSLVRNHTC